MNKIRTLLGRISVLQLVTAIEICNVAAIILMVAIGRLVLDHNLKLILTFLILVQLPVVYEIVTQLRRKPSSLFGAYLGVVGHLIFVPILLITLLLALFGGGLLFLIVLLGAPIIMLGVLVSGWGMPILIFIQPVIWLLLAFKFGKRLHADLKNPLAAAVFGLAVVLYAISLLFYYSILSTLLIPETSPLWESWMFN
jgi:hypothetical protein